MGWRNLSKSTRKVIFTVCCVGCIGAAYPLLVKLGYIFPLSLWNEILCETCSIEPAYHQPPIGAEIIPSRQPIGKLLSYRSNKSTISILIEKSQHRLTIYQNKRAIKSYPIVLGIYPQGDKFSEGDFRTPEGIFYIKDLSAHAQWSKFIALDYPNSSSWRKHFAAKQSGKIPWDKSIGGRVGIHGVPPNGDKLIDNQVNWTLGCISLKTADIDEIYQVSRVGTLVEILP